MEFSTKHAENQSSSNENPSFRLKPIAEFLDGKHHFYIPSYQRGYRWDKKQIEDLLKDICDFAENPNGGEFYCLQPIVVKKNPQNDKQWIVIDGQQRLTTLFLLCKYLQKDADEKYIREAQLYSLEYETRGKIDFNNVDKKHDIDSFHIKNAEKLIQDWFGEGIYGKGFPRESLFRKNNPDAKNTPRQVKFIWYVAENEDEIETIKIFNNLNKGKIRLTNAELIKALFILKADKKNENNKNEELDLKELVYEWNEIENHLHNNRFWYFLANKNYNPATRIDIIFDFLTGKIEKNEDDFSYRKFQKLYDGEKDDFWQKENIKTFTEAWDKVKTVYQTFVYWYEDHIIYHYIGYLINIGWDIKTIYSRCKEKPKDEVVFELRRMIAEIIDYIRIKDSNGSRLISNAEEINELTYTDNRNEIEKLLLLFNIETCAKQITSDYRFSFDKYKNCNWDIEHVDSQTKNPLIKVSDKIKWLSYLKNLTSNHCDWNNLKIEGLLLLKKLEDTNEDKNSEFEKIYDKILALFQSKEKKEDTEDEKKHNINKDTIMNLALLDSGTNRGYGNALFPTKRQKIIEREQAGVFIPICTKNLFMKFYTQKDTETSQWKNTWTNDDAKSYLKAIHKTIDWIFEK
ncbi:MAG: DUF262 domain-containing protein [Firmicutes bacterium]|nr:DUF262 domain-containing protein [Bacillota bacterium]